MAKTEPSTAKLYGIGFGLVLTLAAVSLFLTSWILMLLLGAVHSFAEWVPALGYWQTVLVVLLVQIVAGIIKSVRS